MTDAAGSISLAQKALETTLCGSTAFRTWVGAANAAAAAASIHHDALPVPASHSPKYSLAELQSYRPYALIWTDTLGGFARQRVGSGAYAMRGRLSLWLEQDTPVATAGEGEPEPAPYSPAEVDLQFRNTIGQIVDDLIYLCEDDPTKGYLLINEIRLAAGPHRTEEDDWASLGDAQAVLLQIDWGVSL